MSSYSVVAEKRETNGTGAARRMRRAGKVPAVMYGHGQAGINLMLNAEAAADLVHHNGLISLEIAGRKESASVIVKEIQRHPISGLLLHFDFQEVKADEEITSMVQIEPHGEPAGTSGGGILEQNLHDIEIRCLPAYLPEVLRVEVGQMKVDDTLHVADLVLPEGVRTTAEPDAVVFAVRVPRAAAEAEGAEEAEGPTAPELIGKEEEEEPAAE